MKSRPIFLDGGIMVSYTKILLSCSSLLFTYSFSEAFALSLDASLNIPQLKADFTSIKSTKTKGLQLARVCFVLDAGNCEGYKFNIDDKKDVL